MNICVPVLEDDGLRSRLGPHFGSAPFFAVADTVTGNHRSIRNQKEAHEHGMCNPLGAIRGEHVDVVIVGGIGGGALRKLQAVGIAVMAAQSPTLGEIIAEYNSGPLHEINPEMACTHGHGTPAATGDAFSFAPFTGVRIRRVPGIHGDAGTGVSSIIGSSSPVWSSGAASGPRQGSRPHAPSTADGVTPGPRRWFWPRPL